MKQLGWQQWVLKSITWRIFKIVPPPSLFSFLEKNYFGKKNVSFKTNTRRSQHITIINLLLFNQVLSKFKPFWVKLVSKTIFLRCYSANFEIWALIMFSILIKLKLTLKIVLLIKHMYLKITVSNHFICNLILSIYINVSASLIKTSSFEETLV